MKNLNFPDTIALSHFETAAAINSTIHFIRLQRYKGPQSTLAEMLCTFLQHEREQLIASALASIQARRQYLPEPTDRELPQTNADSPKEQSDGSRNL